MYASAYYTKIKQFCAIRHVKSGGWKSKTNVSANLLTPDKSNGSNNSRAKQISF